MATTNYVNSDIKCESCKASVRVSSLIKLKNRYCCPFCFATVKVDKQNKKKED